ncbi:MAG TPA: MG2 domain-containing protein [Steroidobacteraceae bacterium]|nr:MG2 domain-containing protein [Steroidobacteraceae bacterium]
MRCASGGHGRWADPRNWVYDFDADLEAGVRCRFNLKRGFTTPSGAPLAGRTVFTFNTGGPAVRASVPADGWRTIDEAQTFILRLDAPATTASIEAHAWCAIDGIIERIPVIVLEGTERERILAERAALGYEAYALLWKSGARTYARVRNRSLEQDRDDALTVLRCARRLPPSTQVLLHWGAGIASRSGLATLEDQQLAFRVRPAFTAQVECTRTNPRAGCLPTQPIQVTFSAPVPRTLALQVRLTPTGGEGRVPAPVEPRLQATAGAAGAAGAGAHTDSNAPSMLSPSGVEQVCVDSISFAPPFPERQSVTVSMPPGLVDDAGRRLENGARFPLKVRVDAFAPLIKFSGAFGILEAREGGILPVTVRNVEPTLRAQVSSLPGQVLRLDADPVRIASWLERVAKAEQPSGLWESADDSAGAARERLADRDWDDDEVTLGYRRRQVWRDTTGSESIFDAAAHQGAAEHTQLITLKPFGSRPEQVIGIPLKQPGLYVLEIASPALGASLLGPGAIRYVSTAALVTNLAVHFEWGREGSLVWVTQLDDGAPVPNAEVVVADYCTGESLWQGRTARSGLANVPGTLGEPREGACPWSAPLLVIAKLRDDFSFTVSSWSRGITPYEFGLPVGSERTTGIHHTVLDRALFRGGETVSMKHYIRRHVASGLEVPPGAAGEHKIEILHPGSGQRFELEASFDASGVATSEWRIPAEAKLGTYEIFIDDSSETFGPSARFKVEQFRLPALRASIQGPPRSLVAPREVDLDLHLEYLSGGAAGGMPVKVRTQIEPEVAHIEGYPDYQFGGPPVIEGMTASSGTPFDLDFDSAVDARQAGAGDRVRTVPVALDATGSKRITIDRLPKLTGPARLSAELEYADANGETLTTATAVHLVPSALTLGIRAESWIGSPGQLRFRVLALDLEGKPVAEQPVRVSLYRSNAYSYRKRLIGGFYTYETTTETRRLAASCDGVTDAQGLLPCDLAPGESGQIIVRAESHDAAGILAGATATLWVLGDEAWWFGGTAGDRMDLLPEKKEYEAGEVARFQVRMPFRHATALVSVEREGVLRAFVTELNGTAPLVEVPIRAEDAPNVFVSVLAVRGRIPRLEPAAPPGSTASRRTAHTPAQEPVTALVDLTKPAYRLGTAQIKVGWRPHRLDVRVTPEKSVYEIRDRASVDIEVTRADGAPLPPGTEVALAAVDEALLDLGPNDSWDLLGAMMGERGLEVWTSTGQMQVVGKRHYGRKAIPQGGGGGRELDRARRLFASLLDWRARVPLDAHGHARVVVPLNDSLSAFRLVAVAHSGAQLFGTGTATIHTTQDLILVPGLPPLVREGDRYTATFTLRNTTDRSQSAQVRASSAAFEGALTALEATIAPGSAHDFSWSVTAPIGKTSIDWQVEAHALDDGHRAARDQLEVSQQLIPAYPVRTYQATIAQLASPLVFPAQIPKGAIAGRGGLEISLQDKLADHLDGVREYMTLYRYICLEQQASRAVVFRSRADWDAVMARLPAYMDEDGLLKYFPSERLRGDDGLTAYILSIGDEAGYGIAPADQARMLNALSRFVEGRIIRDSALPTADLAIRKLQALDALSRYHAATPPMLESIRLEPNLMPSSALIDWIGTLQRMPAVPDAQAKIQAALGILRGRLNFQGTTMSFSTERSDALWWLMISSDSNANRLLLSVLARPEWREDVPRLVRGALGRQQFGHWNTTVANAWGILAMEKLSAAFESVAVTGSTEVRYGTARQRIDWAASSSRSAPARTSAPALAPDDPRSHADRLGLLHLDWEKGPAMLAIAHRGAGAPWALVRATAALPLEAPLSTGFKVTRTLTPLEQHAPGVLSKGDVLRVHLDLEAQSDMSWVVVDDPIPAGATVLGSGLGGQSALLQKGERRAGWGSLAYEERRFEAFRAYYRFVPKGHWSVDYTVRLNNPGTFLLPATRIEAMYAPEMFAETPNAPVTVEPVSP